MFRICLLTTLVILIGFAGGICAQDAAQRTRELVAALNKTKYKKKEKANISIEVYVDIKNEPALRSSRSEYSGTYEADGCRLELSVADDGSATGSGFDSFISDDRSVSFTLKNARVEGTLLTATKVYEDGSEQFFEGVFVNRISRAGSNPNAVSVSVTQFGIGFIRSEASATAQCEPSTAQKPEMNKATLADVANRNAGWMSRVFLERK